MTATILPREPLLRSVEGEQLLALARTVEVGELLTYARLRSELQIDVQKPSGYQLWRKAQTVLADEDKMQFACEPKVGYRRLAEGEKLHKSGRYIGQAVKRTRAAGKVLRTVDYVALDHDQQNQHDVQVTVVGLMQNAAKPAIAIANRTTPPTDAETNTWLKELQASSALLTPKQRALAGMSTPAV